MLPSEATGVRAASFRQQADEIVGTRHRAENPTLHLFNKIDLLKDTSVVTLLSKKLPGCIPTSATTGQGMDELTRRVQNLLDERQQELTVRSDVGNGRLIAFLHQNGCVLTRRYDDSTVELRVKMPHRLVGAIGNLGGRVVSSEATASRK